MAYSGDGKTAATAWLRSEVPANKEYSGLEAVRRVEEKLGVTLDEYQSYIVELEGHVDGYYYDGVYDKKKKNLTAKQKRGTITKGTGKTGIHMKESFLTVYDEHIKEMRELLPNYDELTEGVRKEMVSYVYRGDLGNSPSMQAALNKTPPDYKAAFLAASNWDEKNYYDKDAYAGVKARKLRAITAIGKAAGLKDDAIALRMKTVADFLKQDKIERKAGQTKEERKAWNNAKTIRLESYSDPVIRKLMADPKIGKKTLGYLKKGEYGKAAAEVVNYPVGRTVQPISIKHQGLIQGVIDRAKPVEVSSLDNTTNDTQASIEQPAETQGDRLAAIDLDINAEDANNWLNSLNGSGQPGYQQQGLRTVY